MDINILAESLLISSEETTRKKNESYINEV